MSENASFSTIHSRFLYWRSDGERSSKYETGLATAGCVLVAVTEVENDASALKPKNRARLVLRLNRSVTTLVAMVADVMANVDRPVVVLYEKLNVGVKLVHGEMEP